MWERRQVRQPLSLPQNLTETPVGFGVYSNAIITSVLLRVRAESRAMLGIRPHP